MDMCPAWCPSSASDKPPIVRFWTLGGDCPEPSEAGRERARRARSQGCPHPAGVARGAHRAHSRARLGCSDRAGCLRSRRCRSLDLLRALRRQGGAPAERLRALSSAAARTRGCPIGRTVRVPRTADRTRPRAPARVSRAGGQAQRCATWRARSASSWCGGWTIALGSTLRSSSASPRSSAAPRCAVSRRRGDRRHAAGGAASARGTCAGFTS